MQKIPGTPSTKLRMETYLRFTTSMVNKFVGGIDRSEHERKKPLTIRWRNTSMHIGKNIVAILEWSDKSTNAFMAHDTKAIDEFKSEKIKRNPGITFIQKDIPKSEYDSLYYK